MIAVHRADHSRVDLAFEWGGNVEDALAVLEDSGTTATLIDESYSRTVQMNDPDGGPAVWINEKQTDLYGYRRVNPS